MLFFSVFVLSVYREIYDYGTKHVKEIGPYYYSPLVRYIPFPPSYGPLLIWVVVCVYFVVPTKKSLNGRGRRYFWRLMWTCLVSVFYPMTFPISWATDQFVSFVGPLRDVCYTVCFYWSYFVHDDD